MRVCELLTEEPLAAYVSRLAKKHGIKELGSGMFSKVFQHPKLGDVVVKVVSNRDRNFLRYLTWAIEHQDNPYVPKLLDLRVQPGRKQGKYTIVFMEKLRPITPSRLRPKLAKLFGREDAFKLLSSDRADVTYRLLRRAVEGGDLDPHLEELIKYLLDEHEQFDMHEGNFMLRGNQLVFTDPVYSDFNYDDPEPAWYDKRYE